MGVATLFTQQGQKRVSMMSQWSQCRVMVMSQGHIEVIAPHPCIVHHRLMEIFCIKSDLYLHKNVPDSV